LYFVSGIGAGLIDVAAHLTVQHTDLRIPTLGASGAIYGVLMAFSVMFPDRPVFLAIPPVTVKGKYLAIIFGGIEFLASFNTGDNVSHFAHLGGMLFAFIFMKSRMPFGRIREQYALWRRRRLQRRFEIYMTKRDRRTGSGGPWVH
jgi:membrane associated rhomboid family serine protease